MTTPTDTADWRSRAALTPAEAAAALGLSRTEVYRMVRRGDLESMHVGRAVRIPVVALRRRLGEAA
jgi:excisionase family DNA binding protein